jgi:hypothetical protein
MQIQDRYLDAITMVLDWDIPEDGYPEAVNAHACYLAGTDAEDELCQSVWHYEMNPTVH